MEDHVYVARTAEVIATKWTPQLLQALEPGPLGFCDLERAVPGISPRTLSARLRALETAGIVQRDTPATGPSVPYGLTAMGEALLPIVAAMRSFGEEWQCAKPVQASLTPKTPTGVSASVLRSGIESRARVAGSGIDDAPDSGTTRSQVAA